jgi:type VI secretion system protein ImpL
MEGLRQQLETLLKYERDGAPWRLRWGLYSGNRVLPSLYDLYFQRFRQVFYEDIHGSMVAGLSRLPSGPDPANPYNATYDRLKAYRMITQCQCKPNKAFLAPVLADVWTAGRSIDPERQVLAGQQLQFYAEELTHKNPYENKVKERTEVTDRGRQYLSSYGGVERIYRGIVEEANKSRQAARLAELAPNYKESLSSPGEVQAAFTRDGWAFAEKAIKDPNQAALGEPCVLGTTGAVKQLMAGAQVEADLTNLYVADYIRRWKEFITSTSVVSFRGIPDAAKKLQMLADNRSPLLAAVFMVSDNTNFPAAAAPAASLAQKAVAGAASSGALSRVAPGASRAAANAKQVADALPAAAPMATPADITRVFQPAREVVSPTNRDRLIDEPNRQYMNALADLQRSMERLDTTNPDISLHEQARRAYDSGMDAVRQISQKFNISGSEGMDNEFKRLLESPLKEASRFIITDPSKANRDKAAGAARQFCGKFGALERKFPFNPQSDTDATAEEVAAIFAPGSGAFAQMTTQLGKSMVKQGKVWALAPDAEAKLTPDFIRFVNRLSAIQEALFGDGQAMRMRYSLKPVLNANIQSVSLNIDGVSSTATGAQSQAKQFTWPGPAGSQNVDVRVRSGAAIPFASYQGVWGLFRLMQDADPRPAGSKTIEVSKVRQGRGTPQQVMDQNDKPIVLRLEITEFPNGVDVFDKSFFTVRCPGRIAD